MFGSKARRIADLRFGMRRVQDRLDDALSDRDVAFSVSRSAEAWSQAAVAEAEAHARTLRFAALLLTEVGRLRRQLEAEQQNDQLCREAVTRAGTLEVAR